MARMIAAYTSLRDCVGWYAMQSCIKSERDKTMLYRFYRNGVRYTVEAQTKAEATGRFKDAQRTHAREFKKGNRKHPRPRQHKPRVAGTFDIASLNVYDWGFDQGASGRNKLTCRLFNILHTRTHQEQARAGLVAGARLAD